ncbi:MAG TPA: quinoprotein dehydrogenase-associated putative ABC transporter substrate-binding protein [Candidatus Acidoferrum sp.]|nr:quinoprotein dehydrogenase-associated putative ABC transporter substrate-binding protein [Candidatus Acidoferrum sp.]
MYSPSLKFLVGFLLLISEAGVNAQPRELRVCADPNNMPFSSRDQAGFENRIAALVAQDLNARLTFVWQRMGRGFVREYLDKAQCDLVIGIPTNYRPLLTTSPYYRSTYVFVSRRSDPVIPSLDSPALHGLKIGVQVLDEEYTPPGEALARRGLQGAILGFDTIGDGAESIVQAVTNQKVDVSIVWGPLAGYFARKIGLDLTVTPVEPKVDPPDLPFTFAISMGVRKGNFALRDQLEKILLDRGPDIRAILDEYGVPQLPLATLANSQGVAR